jgi:hypothetical protein
MTDSEEKEMAALEAQLKRAEHDSEVESATLRDNSPPPSPPRTPTPPSHTSGSATTVMADYAALPLEELKKLHANLNGRLEPFWSSVLANRKVKVSIHVSPPGSTEKEDLLIDFGNDEIPKSESEESGSKEPLSTKDVLTTPDGDFQQKLRIPWESLCTHPKALYIAFGDRSPSAEYRLFIHAELISPDCDQIHISENPIPTASCTTPITLSHTRLRVISDIDDTVKMSNILGGAKMVFHNVFVSELSRLVIKDMAAWYKRMWVRGVRFHYVVRLPVTLVHSFNTLQV